MDEEFLETSKEPIEAYNEMRQYLIHLKNENTFLRRKVNEQRKQLKGLSTKYYWTKRSYEWWTDADEHWRDLYYEQDGRLNEKFWSTCSKWAVAIFLLANLIVTVVRVPH